jgi:hypothetical protein
MMALAILALLARLFRRIRMWRARQPAPGFDHLGQRYPGVMRTGIALAALNAGA